MLARMSKASDAVVEALLYYGKPFMNDGVMDVKTKMAKSTLDAGWSMLRAMLEYKSHQAGIVFEVVNESYTTQTCSCCGTIPASSPKSRLLTIKPVQMLFF